MINNMENKGAYLVGKKQYEVRDAPMPVIENDNDVLVKIEYVGVCGADIDMWEKGRYGIFDVEYPQIIGHEASGVVVEVGKAVTNLKPGDKVALEPGIPCGVCARCVTGEYNLCGSVVFKGAPPVTGCNQLYVTHPAQWCFILPENLSTRDGALLEPLAVGMHTVNQGNLGVGDTVVIFGGGTIGLCILNACKAKGATKIIVIEQSPARIKAAEKMGAIVVDFKKCDITEKIMELTGGCGADVAIEASGSAKAFMQCTSVLRGGGTIVCVGLGPEPVIEFDYQSAIYKEVTIKTVARYRHVYPSCISCLAIGSISTEGIITHEFGYEDIQKAYEFAFDNKDIAIKTIVKY